MTDEAQPIIGPGDSATVLNYTWTAPGTKTITVTVDNGFDTATGTYAVDIRGGGSSGDGGKVYLSTILR